MSTHKRNRAQYVKARYEELIYHDFFSRLDHLSLEEEIDYEVLEQLDRDWVRSSIYAEKQCTSHFDAPYVEEIAKLRREKLILSRLCSQFANKIDMTSPIEYRLQIDAPTNIPTTPEACRQRISQINRLIVEKLKNAHHLRKCELEQKLEDRKARGDSVSSKVLKQILIAEETKAVTRRLNFMKDSYNSQLNHIQVPVNAFADPKETSDWVTVTSPDAIEKYLLQRNQSHFGQAEGTFPTIEPFKSKVDWSASTAESYLSLIHI